MGLETPQEAEFFSAAAGVAGTLWVITFGLFTFATVSIAGVRNHAGNIRGVLLLSSVGIITISILFLGSMIVALAMLMPREMQKNVLSLSFPGGVLMLVAGTLLLVTGHQKARRRLGKVPWWMWVPYSVCIVILALVAQVPACIGTPDVGICRGTGLGSIRADAFVLVATMIGCILSVLLGVWSMQTELARSWDQTSKLTDVPADNTGSKKEQPE